MKNFRKLIYNQHDVICNQKYGDIHPYSFHLYCAEKQYEKFKYLLPLHLMEIVNCAVIAHDTIEDARFTYNNLKEVVFNNTELNIHSSTWVANLVYKVTDEKGKTRKERKNDSFYKELKSDELAIFVKLCDLAANMIYGKLTNSKMFERYKAEFPNFKEKLYLEKYDDFFIYIENL